MPINKWKEEERPREKMRMQGSGSLSDAELLTILIQNGNREKSAFDLALDLLQRAGNRLSNLARISTKEIMKTKGIGLAKAISIQAALELGRRRFSEEQLHSETITSSNGLAKFLQARFMDLPHEIFAVVFLNRANKIKHFEVISSGGMTGTVADPRIILKKALEEDAVNIILCHNHPSGNLRPSRADEELTKKIILAAKYFDINVLDHIIVSTEGYFSFADEGRM